MLNLLPNFLYDLWCYTCCIFTNYSDISKCIIISYKGVKLPEILQLNAEFLIQC